MKFHGRILDHETDDPSAWPEMVETGTPLVRTQGERYVTRTSTVRKARGGEVVPMGVQTDQQSGVHGFPIFKKPRVTLTAVEKEWLGATVRRSDGAVGQVWALAPRSGYVWVVADGDFWFAVHTDALELVQSRVDQLALDV